MWKCTVVVVLFASLVVRAEEPPKKVPQQSVGGIAEAKDAGTISGVVLF